MEKPHEERQNEESGLPPVRREVEVALFGVHDSFIGAHAGGLCISPDPIGSPVTSVTINSRLRESLFFGFCF